MNLPALPSAWPAPPLGDALAAPVWLSVTVLMVAAAWRWARRLFPGDSYLELVGHTVVLCWAGIVGVATALGSTGCLSGATLLAGAAALALAALAADRARPAPPPGPVPLAGAEKGWLALWVLLFGYWVGHVLTVWFGDFTTDWDSLAYHIPLVDQWLQTGSLNATRCGGWPYPGNNELLALWAVAPFSGDFLVALNNLPSALLFACAGVSVAGRVGLPRPLAHLGGFALVGNFIVLNQLLNAENDVAVAACFFAAVAYALRHVEEGGPPALALGAASLGLLAGVKYYALGYTALAFGVWLLLAALARGPRGSLRVLSAGAAGLVVFGGYWYLRNWALTGSPLYPREFFKHPDLIAQMYPDVANTSFFGNGRPELFALFKEAVWRMTGPCQLAGLLLAPLSFCWLAASAGWSAFAGEPARSGPALAMALLLAGTGVLLGITPFAVEDQPGTLNQMHWHYCPVRYGLSFLSVATLAALLVVRDLLLWRPGAPGAQDGRPPPWGRKFLAGVRFLACVALADAVLAQIVHPDKRLAIDATACALIAVNLLTAGLTLALAGGLWPRLGRGLAVAALAAALPASAWACARLSEHWHRGFVPHYAQMPPFVGVADIEDGRSGPQTILVLQARCYPYFGSMRQHRVFQPNYVPSPEWILEVLRRERVDFVVARLGEDPTTNGMRRFLGFEECLLRNPDRFRVVSRMSDVATFEVVPGDDRHPDRPTSEGRRGP